MSFPHLLSLLFFKVTANRTYALHEKDAELGTPISTKNFGYAQSGWTDLLTSVDGNALSYDNLGNLISYNGYTYTWETGRRLSQMTNGTNTYSYKYDDNGIRTQKTINGITTHYTTVNSRITGQYDATNTIYFRYDATNSLISFNLNGTEYIYQKNIQGDIEGILDLEGNLVVSYTYDAWGKVSSVTGELANTVGLINPMRYRGYYYDTETGYYYLQSRYYNPEICRFINADEPSYIGLTRNTLGYNLFGYCKNAPILNCDDSGFWYYSLNDYNYKVFVKKGINKNYGSVALKYKSYVSQYKYNINKLGNYYKYINGQANSIFGKLKFSSATIANVGCETIAIYNVMKYLGKFIYYPDVINECYINGLDCNSGYWGIMPSDIYKFFNAHNVQYEKTKNFNTWIKKLKKEKIGIMSFWNNKHVFNGLHTVMVEYKNNKFYVYNAYRNISSNTVYCYKTLNALKTYMVGSFIMGYIF